MYYLSVEPQDDFFCFILPSLGAKHEFKYIDIGVVNCKTHTSFFITKVIISSIIIIITIAISIIVIVVIIIVTINTIANISNIISAPM